MKQIQQMHQASRQGDGSPTIQQTLLHQTGIRCGRNRIMRLMHEGEIGPRGCAASSRPRRSMPLIAMLPNPIPPRFGTDRPNQVWLGDAASIRP